MKTDLRSSILFLIAQNIIIVIRTVPTFRILYYYFVWYQMHPNKNTLKSDITGVRKKTLSEV